jgi:hypothetical protein
VQEKDRFTIKRLEKEVKEKDEKTGREVVKFRKYSTIGKVELEEIQADASSAKVIELVSGDNPVKEGDLVIIPGIKQEKLKAFTSGRPMRPSQDDEETPAFVRKKVRQTEEADPSTGGGERGRVFAGSMQRGDNYFGKESSTGTVINKSALVGRVAPHPIFGFEFGWSESPVIDFGIPFTVEVPDFTDLNNVKFTGYLLVLSSIGLVGRIFPFSAEGSERGVFRPYVSGGGQLFLGLYDPNTKSTTSRSVLAFGLGTSVAVGAELGPIFFEAFTRPLSSVQVKYKDPSGLTTNKFVEEFRMDSMGFQAGFRW